MSSDGEGGGRNLSVAKFVAERAGPVERLALLRWAETLLTIRESRAPIASKVTQAMKVTLRSEVIPAVLKLYGAPLKRLAWDDRSWPARVGGITAAATVGIATSEGAGVAALGGAIGVPLWIVVGAGGTFATVLVQELAHAIKRDETTPATATEEIPAGDFVVLPPSSVALPAARRELRDEWESLRAVLLATEKPIGLGKFNRMRLRASAALAGIRERAVEHVPQKKTLYVGVDGCAAGWFSLAIDTAGRSWVSVDPDFTSLLHRWPNARNILVDIPIGLPFALAERSCDIAARRVLGGRRSSVFAAPARATLLAADYVTASAINKSITGRGLSKQSWNICDKIREVDAALNEKPKLARRVREVHPEVLFWALNDQTPLEHYKKTADGEEERLAILERYLPNARALYWNARSVYSKVLVAPDDILDAMAAAVTGLIARGNYQRLPDEEETDERQRRMEMVYVIPDQLIAVRPFHEARRNS